MKTAILLYVATLAATAFGLPATEKELSVETRAVGHVYVCTDKDFSGRCENLTFNVGDCVDLGGGFNNVISSLGHDQGLGFTLYSGTGCSGDGLILGGIVWPGISNLEDYCFNDRANSYLCVGR